MKSVMSILAVASLSLMSFSISTNDTFNFRNQANQAFQYGEELNYRVHYGWINAATINIKVDPEAVKIDGRNTYHVTAKGRTNGSFDWAYKVRDHFESYIDSQSLAPLKYFKSVQEDSYKDVDLVYYDHEKRYLKGKKKSMEMPVYVQDIVSSLFYARSLNFAASPVGTTFPLDVYLDQTIYNLKFKYMGKETISTDIGKIRCIKLRPQLVVDRVFKDEDDMTVWVTDDANRVPVRVQTDIWVGSLKVDLVNYKNLRNSFTSKVK
jgi:hypothetical protein